MIFCSISGVSIGAGEYAPIPPVFGPSSPSPTWRREGVKFKRGEVGIRGGNFFLKWEKGEGGTEWKGGREEERTKGTRLGLGFRV